MKNKIIDLRSDTVTLPSPGMYEAMMSAPLGDDVYGEDPSVNALQAQAAKLFGMEAALFCPSGTMTNQIAIQLFARARTEVICDELAHVFQYEGGGIACNAGASTRTLVGNRGRLSAEQVKRAIRGNDLHEPQTTLVCLENTSNRGGGSCYDWNEILQIRDVCDAHGLALHLDGARLFNALVATKQTAAQYGKVFDTISICLSKGLGAPVGSLVLGKRDSIQEALRIRKVMGGAMRQAGILAAAGLYALEHNINRLADDHRRANVVGAALAKAAYVDTVLPVETNIILFKLIQGVAKEGLYSHLQKYGVKAGGLGSDWVRFVLHLNVDEAGVDRILAALASFHK